MNRPPAESSEAPEIGLIISWGETPRILSTEGQPPEKVWTIGRSLQSDIVLSFPQVSGQHARLRYEEESAAWQICDCGSTNGILLDGRQIPPHTWHPIRDNTIALFGATQAVIAFKTRIHSTLRQQRERTDDIQTQARTEPMSLDEWIEANRELRHYHQPVLEQLAAWVMQPATPAGGIYRLVVLALLAIAGIALAVWAS